MSATNDVGIRCRGCGCQDLRTTHTRRVREGMVRRYKECRNCGRRLTTHESTTKAAVKRRIP